MSECLLLGSHRRVVVSVVVSPVSSCSCCSYLESANMFTNAGLKYVEKGYAPNRPVLIIPGA